MLLNISATNFKVVVFETQPLMNIVEITNFVKPCIPKMQIFLYVNMFGYFFQ